MVKLTEIQKNDLPGQAEPSSLKVATKMVSIIIPAYHGWNGLQKCINALHSQTYPKDFVEVIIINNDPADPHPSDLWLPENFTLISESKKGSYAARNAGLKLAKGEIIGFTDADCIPDKQWIENAVRYMEEHPSCSRVAGNISVLQNSSKHSVIDVYNKMYSFPQQASVDLYSGGMTANMFTYRYVLERVGPFNDSFLSFGDQEWGGRAKENGFQVHYLDSAVVYHPARRWKELIQREKRLGGGTALLKKMELSRWQQIKECLSLMKPHARVLKTLRQSSHELRWKDLVLIPVIHYYLDLIRSLEMLRVILGKKPNRS